MFFRCYFLYWTWTRKHDWLIALSGGVMCVCVCCVWLTRLFTIHSLSLPTSLFFHTDPWHWLGSTGKKSSHAHTHMCSLRAENRKRRENKNKKKAWEIPTTRMSEMVVCRMSFNFSTRLMLMLMLIHKNTKIPLAHRYPLLGIEPFTHYNLSLHYFCTSFPIGCPNAEPNLAQLNSIQPNPMHVVFTKYKFIVP